MLKARPTVVWCVRYQQPAPSFVRPTASSSRESKPGKDSSGADRLKHHLEKVALLEKMLAGVNLAIRFVTMSYMLVES